MTRRPLFAIVLLVAALTVACGSPQPQGPAQWGQGYETAQGYQEPVHGYWYYWWLYHGTMGLYQPTVVYHVYTPPYGYSSNYRPWGYAQHMGTTVIYTQTPTYRPGTPYSRPTAVTPARASGGFAPQATASGRTTGGFAPKPAAPPPQTRSSGGFSASRPSSSRSTGGFSRKGK